MQRSEKPPDARNKPAPLFRRRVVLLIVCLGLTAIVIVVGYFNHVANNADLQLLRGNWVRNDGDKFLVVRDVAPDGHADVRYFNPTPITVAEAKVDRTEKGLRLYVKLDDIGYPGSSYALFYDPDKDELHGSYFAAGQQEMFDVYFTREK